MDLILKRTLFNKDGILGELISDNGIFECATLEHAYPINSHGFEPKLPTGLYTCVRGMHRLSHMPHPFETFEIMNVPGHTGILFHPGNFNNDSEGCVLLGEYHQGQGHLLILNSQKTFERFIKAQNGINEFC